MMRYAKTIFIFFLLVTGQSLSYSQSLLKQVLPPSPDAASLGKFAAFPVNLYNGVPKVDIPIWNIDQFGMKVPISLSYHAGGIQVAEVPSWVGIGWALNAGGLITRSVQGLPDEASGGWLTNPLQALPECTGTLGTGDAAYDYFEAVTRGANDTESDTYYFNFCGRSGKFVFDKSGNPHIVPYQKMNIKRNSPTSFEITTEDGNVYTFDVIEQLQSVNNATGYDAISVSTYYISCWYLREIKSAKSNQKITFEYTSSRCEYNMPSTEVRYVPYSSPAPCVSHGSISTNKVIIDNAKKISKITFPSGSVEFTPGKYRHDLQGGQVLDKIVVKNATGTIKSYALSYNYFSFNRMTEFSSLTDATATTEANTGYRLSLKGLQELSANGTGGPAHIFTYENNVWLPDRVSSYAVDHWGYYNGETYNKTLIPSYVSSGTFVNGAIRTANGQFSKAGTLKKIQYPTGGATTFEYESNESSSGVQWQEVEAVNYSSGAGSCYVSTSGPFELFTTTPFEITFTGSKWPTNTNTNCTIQSFNIMWPWTYIYFELFNVNDPANPVNMEILGKGIYGPLVIGYASSNFTGSVSLPPGKYQIQQRIGGRNGAVNTSSVSADGYYSLNLKGTVTKQYSTNKVGGIRIKEMTDYDPVANKSITKVYNYNINDTTSSGKINFIPTYKYTYKEAQLCRNATGGYDVKVPAFDVYSSSSFAPLTYMQSGNVGYDKVTVYYGKETNGTVGTNGKSEYYYNTRTDFSFRPSDVILGSPQNICYNNGRMGQTSLFPFASPVSVDWARGQVIQEINYKNVNGSFVKVDETLNTYKDDYQGSWDTYNASYDVLGAKVDWSLRVPQQNNLTPKPMLAVQYYFVPSRYIKLSKTEKRTYDVSGANYLSNITDYTYNDANGDLQLKTETTQNSKGTAVKKEYKYPGDYPSVPVYASMKTANMLDAPVEVNTYKDNVFSKGQTNSYTQVGSLFVQSNSEVKIGTTSAAKYNFPTYDSYGNILEQQKRDDIFYAYIFDYAGAQLVAEARNARYDDIAYTSFEADGKGNWTFAGTPVAGSPAPSGAKYYNLSGGSLTRSGLTTTTTYIVSYWTKNSTPYSITGTQSGSPVKGETINGWTYYEHLVTGQSTITISGTGFIDEVRAYPQNAQMTTYTWNPLVGITAQADATGQITYYSYDEFGRLALIKDRYGNILKKLDYAYGQAISATPIP